MATSPRRSVGSKAGKTNDAPHEPTEVHRKRSTAKPTKAAKPPAKTVKNPAADTGKHPDYRTAMIHLPKLPRVRFRHVFLLGGSAVVVAALFFTDPDHGLSTGALLLSLAVPFLALLLVHWTRKAWFDYGEADMRRLFAEARTTSVGAGLALVALSIILSALLSLFGRAAHAAVPERAAQYLPILAAEIDRGWPDVPQRAYLPALVEHESCITLTHPRCWQPTSRLKTAREEGAGLGQITRAWSADGRLRFDALADLRAEHPALRELDWATIYQRPDLQLRALVTMSRANYLALRAVADPAQRLAMADAAYNGGLAGVHRERRICQMSRGCDPQRWWGHVAEHCAKSRAALYAGRSACDINRHHVSDVIRVRAPRYQGLV